MGWIVADSRPDYISHLADMSWGLGAHIGQCDFEVGAETKMRPSKTMSTTTSDPAWVLRVLGGLDSQAASARPWTRWQAASIPAGLSSSSSPRMGS